MQVIGAAAGSDIDVRRCGAAVLRLVSCRLHTELGDAVETSSQQACSALAAIRQVWYIDPACIYAVNRIRIQNDGQSVKGQIRHTSGSRDRTRRAKTEAREVPAVDGQIGDLLTLETGAGGYVGGYCLPNHDLFVNVAGTELEIDADCRRDSYVDLR